MKTGILEKAGLTDVIFRDEKEIPAFLITVQKCRGEVILKTEMGDRLNLKSMLSQFVLISGFHTLRQTCYWIEIHADDVPMLSPFLREDP